MVNANFRLFRIPVALRAVCHGSGGKQIAGNPDS